MVEDKKRKLMLWLMGFPLIFHSVWFAHVVYTEYSSPWIPTRTFPQRPQPSFYILMYFVLIPFSMFLFLCPVSIILRIASFVIFIAWIVGILLLYRKHQAKTTYSHRWEFGGTPKRQSVGLMDSARYCLIMSCSSLSSYDNQS
jgi:hypothetical protein